MKREELYFDINNCNKFNEKNTDGLIHIYNAADEPPDENENLWTYTQGKCIFLSKTAFIIKSKLLFTDFFFEETTEVGGGNANSMLMDTNFASVFSFSQINARIKLPASQHPPVRTICPTCHCKYIGETCIHCDQNRAFECGLLQDVALTNRQALSEAVSETQISNEHEVRKTDELRQRRLDHFWNINGTDKSSSTSTAKNLVVLKINRLNIKNELIKNSRKNK